MAPGVFDGSFLGVPHPMLDLGEGLLDGVEIGRVWRQEPDPCACGPDGVTDGCGFMAAQIVHDHDVAGLQGRQQLLLDIGAEAFTVDRTVEDAWRGEFVATQRPQEGQGSPMAMRGEATQAPSPWAPAAKRGHVGLDPRLIDEDQAPDRGDPATDLQRWRRRAMSARPCSRANNVFFEAQALAPQEHPDRVVRNHHPV